MSENMASSTSLGSRPIRATMSAYSASVSPSATASDSDTLGHRFEDAQAVDRPREGIDRVLGMGHQAEHVARRVAHAGDLVLGAVEAVTGRVAQHDLRRIEIRRVEAAGLVLGRD